METQTSDLDKEIDLLLSAEKSIEAHRMRAISERVAHQLSEEVNSDCSLCNHKIHH